MAGWRTGGQDHRWFLSPICGKRLFRQLRGQHYIGTVRGRRYVDPSGLPVVQGPPVQWTVRRKAGAVVVAVASGENHEEVCRRHQLSEEE